MEKLSLTEEISYIKGSENPLSADVIFIKGNTATWIFDVGACEDTLNEINSISGVKNIIISHFHGDHSNNLSKIDYNELYVSKYTYKYTETGTLVDEDLYIDDGVKLHIFKIPSSHEKGCLGLEINEDLILLGDSFYPSRKGGKRSYNVQQIKAQIDLFSSLKGTRVYLSHDKKPIISKTIAIAFLKKTFALRDKNKNIIEL